MHVCTALHSKTSPIGCGGTRRLRAPNPNPALTAQPASECRLGCRSPRLIRTAHTRVELVCVDELHNLNLATRAGAEVSDQLKYFAERLPATFIYAGTLLPAPAQNAGDAGPTAVGLGPSAYSADELRTQFMFQGSP